MNLFKIHLETLHATPFSRRLRRNVVFAKSLYCLVNLKRIFASQEFFAFFGSSWISNHCSFEILCLLHWSKIHGTLSEANNWSQILHPYTRDYTQTRVCSVSRFSRGVKIDWLITHACLGVRFGFKESSGFSITGNVPCILAQWFTYSCCHVVFLLNWKEVCLSLTAFQPIRLQYLHYSYTFLVHLQFCSVQSNIFTVHLQTKCTAINQLMIGFHVLHHENESTLNTINQ